MKNNIIFLTSRQNQIQISVYTASESLSDSCILGLHGFKGFKDWGFWPFIAGHLAEAGHTVLLINFSHNGIGPIEDEFTELDKFRANTFSLELEEASEVLTALQNGTLLNKRFQSIHVLGHSRGGAIGLLSASHPAVKSLVTLGSVAKLDRFTKRQKSEWEQNGFLSVINTRTNQELPLGIELYHDFTEHANIRLNLQVAAERLKKPWLIIHGAKDVTVPVREGVTLFEWSDSPLTDFIEIPNSGHTFEATHPFTEPSPGLLSVLEHTVRFFSRVAIR